MPMPLRTPDDIRIEKRDLKFGRETPPPRWWHSGDPGRTAFFNALSSTFPVGETFFMTSVRHYREGTPQPLPGDRKSVALGKRVSVRVDLGGGRITKKKTTKRPN